MKKYTFLALAAMALPAVAQQYKISGIAPKDASIVYLRNAETARDARPDSIVLKADRTFAFSGEADGKLIAQVYTDRKSFDAIPLVLDGDVTVSLDDGTATGTPENDALTKAWAEVRGAYAEMAKINEEAEEMQNAGTLTQEAIEPLAERYTKNGAIVAELTKKVCNENPNAVFPAYFLRDFYTELDRADILRWDEEGAAFMKISATGHVQKVLSGWKLQAPGAKFVDLEEADPQGKLHKLSEYVGNGNYVLVDFWASWCGPCMKEVPHVKAAYEKFHAKGFDIVGLSLDKDRAAWTGAIERKGMTWHHLSDLKGWDSLASNTYGINSIPATILYGPDGTVVASNLRGEALTDKLKEIYGE